MGKRKGKCVKKNPASKESLEPENLVKAPHSFVIHRGQCSKNVIDLMKDFRKVMEPFTASQLKERKKNTIKDFVSISGYLHVSHMMLFTETELGTYMRMSRLPRGPTLTFKIHDYSLSRDVISSLRKQYVMMRAFQHAPLIVLNSFSGEGMHMKLMATMFQNMFPTINITTVKLKHIRRCVLMNYNPATKLIDMRHYAIRATPVGLNKGTKKMVQGKIPNLNRCKDMSEFFDKAGMLSESEFEDDPNAQVILPQTLSSRGAAAESKSAIRLFELGPRITFQLIKVEDGLMDGEVLFHELVEKTDEEKKLIKKKREAKQRLKEKRKSKQEQNVKRKEQEKEELKQKALEGIKKKKETTENQRLMELAAKEGMVQVSDDDDDADYYRQEVGQEPEYDLFSKDTRKRKGDNEEPRGFKKMRLDKKVLKKYSNNRKEKTPQRKDQNQSFHGKKNSGTNNRRFGERENNNRRFGERESNNRRPGEKGNNNRRPGERGNNNRRPGDRGNNNTNSGKGNKKVMGGLKGKAGVRPGFKTKGNKRKTGRK